MRKSPTIYDVARAAGVAPSTVSRALSRPNRLNPDTVQRVRSVAADLGYRAASETSSTPAVRTRLIALIVPDISNPFYFEIIRGAEEAASERGYTLVLADTQESQRLEHEALGRAMPSVDGLVLTSTRMGDSAIVAAAREKPLVVLNRAVTDVPSIITDNAAGARRALMHLHGLGHREVTYVAGPEASWADGVRWSALRDAALEMGIRVRRIGPFAPTIESGPYAAQVLADRPTTGVICYNDQIAVGMMRGLAQLGLRVPGDVSVVGFDNTLVAELVTPGLTTVAAPLGDLGATGVQRLLDGIDGSHDGSTEVVVLPSLLAVRASTGPSRQAPLPQPPLSGAHRAGATLSGDIRVG